MEHRQAASPIGDQHGQGGPAGQPIVNVPPMIAAIFAGRRWRNAADEEEESAMARRGDGLYQRGKTWWLDFTHDGRRHVARLGKGINRTVAGELAAVKRAAILKGEAGIGGRSGRTSPSTRRPTTSSRGPTATSARGRRNLPGVSECGSREPSPGRA